MLPFFLFKKCTTNNKAKWGSWISCSSIAWALVRNVNSWTPPRSSGAETLGAGPNNPCYQKTSMWLCTNIWEWLLYTNVEIIKTIIFNVVLKCTKWVPLTCQLFPNSISKVCPSTEQVQPVIRRSEFSEICMLCYLWSDQGTPTLPGGARAPAGQALLSWSESSSASWQEMEGFKMGVRVGDAGATSDAGNLLLFHQFRSFLFGRGASI